MFCCFGLCSGLWLKEGGWWRLEDATIYKFFVAVVAGCWSLSLTARCSTLLSFCGCRQCSVKFDWNSLAPSLFLAAFALTFLVSSCLLLHSVLCALQLTTTTTASCKSIIKLEFTSKYKIKQLKNWKNYRLFTRRILFWYWMIENARLTRCHTADDNTYRSHFTQRSLHAAFMTRSAH